MRVLARAKYSWTQSKSQTSRGLPKPCTPLLGIGADAKELHVMYIRTNLCPYTGAV